jgi:CRISPR system Cascade subunit CasC
MASPRFLQLHTLTSFPASLLNRDDAGFAKRIPFGDAVRTRISSQCLKRHWRTSDGENALSRITVDGGSVPMSLRSRRTFEKYLRDPLVEDGVAADVAQEVTHGLLAALLPEGKRKQASRKEKEKEAEGDAAAEQVRTEQVTVIGRPEIDYLLGLAREVAAGAADAADARKRLADLLKDRDLKANLATLRLGAGLDAALFGRMTTGDVLARCDAAVHVAHAFTVHRGQFETDYFSAIDDLQEAGETGSGHINTSELASGLYYGYVVVDVPLLVSNLTGCRRPEWESADRTLAAEVVQRLVHLVATVSPGAKLGATAPYAYAHLMLAESGNAQPRTLANAFLEPVGEKGMVREAYQALREHLAELDAMYGNPTSRRLAALGPRELLSPAVAGDDQGSLPELAQWAAARVRGE